MEFSLRLRILIVVTLYMLFTTVLAFSQETQTIQHPKTKENLKLYPNTLDHFPNIPSPFTTEDGMEIMVAFTKNKKYALIPVTVTNRPNEWKQLEVDAKDFPTLARTELHSEIEASFPGKIYETLTDHFKRESISKGRQK